MSVSCTFRYERKFVIADLPRRGVEHVVRRQPALFRGIYQPRYVNNIYFDTSEYGNYRDGVDGASNRLKVRIRWYGNFFGAVEHPVLELKFKREVFVSKETFPLAGLTIERGMDLSTVADALRRAALPMHVRNRVKGLRPVLFNRYLRNYFLSADKTCRITIDDQLSWYSAQQRRNAFLRRVADRQSVILEMKYAQDDADAATRIAAILPFRMGRCSKYVGGMQRLFGAA